MEDYSEKIKNLEKQIKEDQENQNKLIEIISHDLKTPLTTVIGFSQIIKQKPTLSEENRAKCIDAINKESTRMLKMLNNILTWQQIHNKTLRLCPEKINLSSILLKTVKELDEKIKDNKITVDIEIDTDLNMTGDQDRLKEIIENILENSIKFTGDSGKITLKAYIPEKNIIKLSLSDNGVGIKDEIKKNIFKKTTPLRGLRGEKGLGLGLFITKTLVGMHSGQISFTSSDKGTEFNITFNL